MKENINSISLVYGNARFNLYQFNLFTQTARTESVLHDHKFYEIHMADEGSYTYTSGEKQISLSQDQILIIPPGVYHSSVPNAAWNYKFSVLSFSLSKTDGEDGYFEFFQKALKDCSLTPINIPQKFIKRAAELSRRELYGTVKGECYLKMQASALIYELFDILNKFGIADAPKKSSKKGNDNLMLLDALINDPSKSLNDIAAAICYSSRHTARLIKSIYGCSITEQRKKQSIVTKED